MNMLALDMLLVIVWLLWDMASLGKLVSGVLLRPRMTFHTSGPSAFDIELCKRSFQLVFLASLIAMFASRQATIHSCQFRRIVQWRWLQLWIFDQTCGLIQGFWFLTQFDFADVKWGWRFENVVESWDTDWNVRLFWKLLHSWFNLVGKRELVNAIAVPPGLPWDDILVSDSVVDDDGDWQVVWNANRFC